MPPWTLDPPDGLLLGWLVSCINVMRITPVRDSDNGQNDFNDFTISENVLLMSMTGTSSCNRQAFSPLCAVRQKEALGAAGQHPAAVLAAVETSKTYRTLIKNMSADTNPYPATPFLLKASVLSTTA